jgi:DNA polymerase IV
MKNVAFHKRAIETVDLVVPVRQLMSIDEMERQLTGRWRERTNKMAIAMPSEKKSAVTWADV